MLDEPLSALDAPLRDQLRRELRRWLTALGVPALVVTHDRTEVQGLGDSVVVMDSGRVRQTGTVDEIFSRPTSLEVARIVGVETVVAAEVVQTAHGLTEIAIGSSRLWALAEKRASRKVFVMIRGEDVLLTRAEVAATSGRNGLAGVVQSLGREGPMVRVVLDCGFPLTALVTQQASSELHLSEGTTVRAMIEVLAVHLIPRN